MSGSSWAVLSINDIPSPHVFCNLSLQSGVWDKKSSKELVLEKNKLLDEHSKSIDQFRSAKDELLQFLEAKKLDSKLPDKSKNSQMNEVMKFYESYFDEDSGNTREEGIKQLEEFLRGEVKTYGKISHNIMDNIKEIKDIVDNRWKKLEELRKTENAKTVEENKKLIEENKPVEEKKPVEENKKSVEENNKLVEENNKSIEEKKTVEEHKRPVEEKKTVEEHKRPVEEKKTVEENKKPVEENNKPIEENKTLEEKKIIIIIVLTRTRVFNLVNFYAFHYIIKKKIAFNKNNYFY